MSAFVNFKIAPVLFAMVIPKPLYDLFKSDKTPTFWTPGTLLLALH
jgi:hypothetical protein